MLSHIQNQELSRDVELQCIDKLIDDLDQKHRIQRKIQLTGGTGSFGKKFVDITLERRGVERILIYSRDEMKQWEMKNAVHDERVEFILGDVRDGDRLNEACKGIDTVVHAAATKIVPTAETNPTECIKTNIDGAINVIKCAKANE